MRVMKEYSYKIFSSKNGEELCEALFLFQQNSSIEHLQSGRVDVMLNYDDLNISFGSKQNKKLPCMTWEKDSRGSYFCTQIGDFILPPCLRGEGIGLFIWSEIKNNLPTAVGANLRISGTLSRVDAEVPLLDKRRRFVYDSISPFKKVKTINNIESRNRFWRKLLAQGPDGELISFQYDANGDGAFSGWLKDPLLDMKNHRPTVIRIA